jgi:hypothetical protein
MLTQFGHLYDRWIPVSLARIAVRHDNDHVWVGGKVRAQFRVLLRAHVDHKERSELALCRPSLDSMA